VKVDGSDVTISLSPLINPGVPHKILEINADSDNAAAEEAAKLLKMIGIPTHSRRGNPTLILADFPNFFVGKLETKLAKDYDTTELAFHINTFTPVPE
jgi:hypothetical protein